MKMNLEFLEPVMGDEEAREDLQKFVASGDGHVVIAFADSEDPDVKSGKLTLDRLF